MALVEAPRIEVTNWHNTLVHCDAPLRVAFGGKRTCGVGLLSRDSNKNRMGDRVPFYGMLRMFAQRLEQNRMGDRVPFYGMLRMFAAAVGLASGLTLAHPRHSCLSAMTRSFCGTISLSRCCRLPGRDSVPIVDLADPGPSVSCA